MLSPKHLGKINRNTATAAVKGLVLVSAGLLFSLVAGIAPLHAQSVSGLAVQDRSHDNDDVDNQLYADYEIDNLGTGTTPTAVPLSTLTMRYWFTNNNTSDPPVFNCDYALVTCANITSQFVTLTNTLPLANMYLQIGFCPPLALSSQVRIAAKYKPEFTTRITQTFSPTTPIRSSPTSALYIKTPRP